MAKLAARVGCRPIGAMVYNIVMAELKTFLFTDIVGSVELKRQMPGRSDAERDQAFIERVLMPHRERIERELAAQGGRVVSTAGDGNFLVFADTTLAARWAVGIQQLHRDEPIEAPGAKAIAVRISMHLGIPQIDPHDSANFVGKPVDYASRLCDYATGGQILVSRSVVAVLEDAGMDGVSFHRHGHRELKGIGQVEVFELVYDEAGPRKMRPQPRESLSRQWTVLPATMGLTEYRGVAGVGSGGARPQAPETMLHASDVAPARLGNYEIETRLGSGGMGDVYRARHVQFGRKRAVKVIRQHFVESGHREVIRRFYQEIKAVGALEHPNIVVAIDSSAPTDPVHYLVMEYIDGIGADVLVAQHGPLPVADACEIARQAARGLAYIQQHGMVHRDIKPSNLMLTVVRAEEFASGSTGPKEVAEDQAVVKILDLGLALLVGDDQQRLTMMDNRAMGTAMYMSPEQWRTTSVDIRADIYSLGCTLYHLLAGKPPYWESDLRPEKAHEREKLPPIRIDDPLPRPLWDVLQKMTAKKPEDRFVDPGEVANALAPFVEGNQLPRLVWQAMKRAQPGFTQGVAGSETKVSQSGGSDTRSGRKPSSRGSSLPQVTRRVVWRAVMAATLLASVAAIGWLAVLATGSLESEQEAQKARMESLQTAASFAANQILDQINLRFDTLSSLAAEDEMRAALVEIDLSPENETLWAALEKTLAKIRSDSNVKAPADSWFINDARGVQVARSPSSEASRGDNFSHRDYFHGGGADLPEGTPGLTPIKQAHLSAVYRSTTTGLLKVAFSVPIENGRTGDERKTVGVLAMSVDLGEFNVLSNDLPPGQEVVLVDRRETSLAGSPPRRGLILHHHAWASSRQDQSAPWVSPELMARIEETLTSPKAGSSQSAIPLAAYRDANVTRGEPYWGAMKTVLNRRAEGEVVDTQWLVLVQEKAPR